MLNNDLSAKKDSKKGDYGDGRGGARLISFVICIAISEHHNVFFLLKQIIKTLPEAQRTNGLTP